MKLKKIIALLTPLLLFSLFAYADIDSGPDYIIVTLFSALFIYGSLLIFIIAFIKRYDGNNHKADTWIYISSMVLSCIIIFGLFKEFNENGISKDIILPSCALIFFITISIITYKKSNTKLNQ